MIYRIKGFHRDAKTGEQIRLFTKLDGLPDNDVEALLSDGSGGIYIGTGGIGTDGGLAHRAQDGSWTVYDTKNSTPPES